MDYKPYIKPATRVGVIALVITGILILFGVTWWIAVLSVLAGVGIGALIVVWFVKKQRRELTARLKSFNIDPEKGRINPADLRRMYNTGGQAQKDAVLVYCLANNNCPEADAHKAFKEMSVFNPAARKKAMQEMQEMQKGSSKGKGKGRGGIRPR